MRKTGKWKNSLTTIEVNLTRNETMKLNGHSDKYAVIHKNTAKKVIANGGHLMLGFVSNIWHMARGTHNVKYDTHSY